LGLSSIRAGGTNSCLGVVEWEGDWQRRMVHNQRHGSDGQSQMVSQFAEIDLVFRSSCGIAALLALERAMG